MTIHPLPPREDTLIPFPGPADPPVPATGAELTPAPPVLDGELLCEQDNAAVAARLSGHDRVPARVLALARVVANSPRTAHLAAVAAYRARQAPGTSRGCAGSPFGAMPDGSPRDGPGPPMGTSALMPGPPG